MDVRDTLIPDPIPTCPCVGDLSPELTCSCGERFRGEVQAVYQYVPDEPALAFVTHTGGCRSTITYACLPC
jgi:hypothetical protein